MMPYRLTSQYKPVQAIESLIVYSGVQMNISQGHSSLAPQILCLPEKSEGDVHITST